MIFGFIFGCIVTYGVVYFSTHPIERSAIGSRLKDWYTDVRDEIRALKR